MNVISTTIDYKGHPIKIENGNVYLWGFGTTINNHTMHGHWINVNISDLKSELREYLKENKLI